MQFNEDFSIANYQLHAYGQGWVQINETRLEHGFILSPDLLITDWEPTSFRNLQAHHLDLLFEIQAEIIVIGTGKTQALPNPDVYEVLINNGAGFELMTTDAACRTYHVLTAEGRSVAAALFPS